MQERVLAEQRQMQAQTWLNHVLEHISLCPDHSSLKIQGPQAEPLNMTQQMEHYPPPLTPNKAFTYLAAIFVGRLDNSDMNGLPTVGVDQKGE